MEKFRFNVELANNGIIIRDYKDSDNVSVTEYGKSYSGGDSEFAPAYNAIGCIVFENLLECKTSQERYIIGFDVKVEVKLVTQKKREYQTTDYEEGREDV